MRVNVSIPDMARNGRSGVPTGQIQRAGRASVLLAGTLLMTVTLMNAQVTRLSTNKGVEFGIVGMKPTSPRPTLFIFASTFERTLSDPNFNRMGMILRRERGVLLVSMDLPAHGGDRRAGEPEELNGWAFRIAKGEDPITPFTRKASEVLSFLIDEGYTAPNEVLASGTSRGGFIALHFTAEEPRIRGVVAFAPVTDLTVLSEFHALGTNALARSLAAARLSGKIAGRPVWLCIGNNDERVGTDHAIAFSRRLVEEAVVRGVAADVTLEVNPAVGHTLFPDAHDNAARWVMSHLLAVQQTGPGPHNGSDSH